MSWDTEEPETGWTRREWVRLGISAASFGAVAGLGGLVAGQILPPPYKIEGEIRETIQYTKFPTPQWWNGRAGTPVRVTDMSVWQGATGVWRGLFNPEGRWLPGTGYPVLIIRVQRDDQSFSVPSESEWPNALPDGFNLYFDDPALDAGNGGTRIVVIFDRCVHLCCYPGWHVVDNPPPAHDYELYFPPGTNLEAEVPTFYRFSQEPIYCVCHGSQYEPMKLVVNTHPSSRARYIGAQRAHGPAERALAVVPVRRDGQNLVGGLPLDPLSGDPVTTWYVYC
jgi:Rieske Fe-S protein